MYNLITDTANAQIFTVQNITVHPLNDKELFRYDFALVHIHEIVNYITPIRLNSVSSVPLLSDDLTVVGWGAIQSSTSTSSSLYPSTLQKGSVQALTNDNCEATVVDGLALYEGEIYDEMLCAEGLVRVVPVCTLRSPANSNILTLDFHL